MSKLPLTLHKAFSEWLLTTSCNLSNVLSLNEVFVFCDHLYLNTKGSVIIWLVGIRQLRIYHINSGMLYRCGTMYFLHIKYVYVYNRVSHTSWIYFQPEIVDLHGFTMPSLWSARVMRIFLKTKSKIDLCRMANPDQDLKPTTKSSRVTLIRESLKYWTGLVRQNDLPGIIAKFVVFCIHVSSVTTSKSEPQKDYW